MSSRSRSDSRGSRGECKNCISSRGKWQDHLCLRHAPCMDSTLHLWTPDSCAKCSSLLSNSDSDDHKVSSETRNILKEIMRSAEAAAARRNLSGFVSQAVFSCHFQTWMGTFHSQKSVRPALSDAEPPPLTWKDEPSLSRSRSSTSTLPLPPLPNPPTRSNDPITLTDTKARISSPKVMAPSQEPHHLRSPSKGHGSQLSLRSLSPSQRRTRSPSYEHRKRSSYTASPYSHHEGSRPKRPRYPYDRYESRSHSRSSERYQRKRHSRHYRRRSRSPDNQRYHRRGRSQSRGRPRRRYYSPSLSPCRRHSRSRSGNNHSRSQSDRSLSEEDCPSHKSETASRPLSPIMLTNPSTSRRDIFGSDSEDALPPDQPRASSAAVSPTLTSRPTPVLSPPESGKALSQSPPQLHNKEQIRHDLTYYRLSPEAHLSELGLSLPDLPEVPRSSLHIAKIKGRPAVAFLDPSEYPALGYISRLGRICTQKEPSLSHRDNLRCLNRIIQAGERHQFGFNWEIQNHDSQDSEFSINVIEALEEYAESVSKAKGYGDESQRPPLHPYVPLQAKGPKLQRLIDFLQAGSLSPTSHHLRRGYRDGRVTREPPKPDRETDHEYRRAAPSALGIKLAWLFMQNVLDLPNLLLHNKMETIKAVINVFSKDVDNTMDYQVTRAVHHRRNMIQMATRDMPQADVRAAIQDLPLPAGSTLFHESAALTVEATLQKPEGRALAIIRDRRPKKPFHPKGPPPGKPQTAPAPAATSAPVTTTQRKPTRPAPPSSYIPKAPGSRPKTIEDKPRTGGKNVNSYSQKQSRASSKPSNGRRQARALSRPSNGATTWKGSPSSKY